MRFDLRHYVPCLRWKQGEYQALLRLSPYARDSIVPLIEVPEIGFDFETQRDSKSIDEHLSAFAKRVKEKWGVSRCLVDMHLIESSQRMTSGQHPLEFVFDDLRVKGALAIPVIRLKPDSHCQNVVEKILEQDGRGLCLRVNIEEAADNGFDTALEAIIERFEVGVQECDFVLDVGAPNYDPIEGFTRLLETIIGNIPHLNQWRSFALIGTSFPASMGVVKRGLSIIPRNEWRLYNLLVNNLRVAGLRIPSFGDYGISHPEVLSIDMRIAKPAASVRYTIDNSWLIVKGSNVREDNGLSQYRRHCQTVVESAYFSGATFSMGDKYIYDCARGAARTGNLTTWRWVGTNHHVEKVVSDLASLFGSSNIP